MKIFKNKIIYLILIIITPIFLTLAIISMHTLYLIKKPLNYVFIVLSIICLVMVIIYILVNKKNYKNLIIYLITFLINTILILIFILNNMWSLLNNVIEYYYIYIIVFILIIVLLGVLFKKISRKHKNCLIRIFLTIYVLLFVDGLLVLYAPFSEFNVWLITTAMQTKNHQYFCKWFYSEDEINNVMSDNYTLESGESTDPSLIDVNKSVVEYENEYEEAILSKENEDDLYKIITFEVNGCNAYLAVIYDPTSIKVAVTKNLGVSGQYVTKMASDNNAVLAINGGGFYDPNYNSSGGMPTGITIANGNIITNNTYSSHSNSGGLIGFDDDGILYLLKNTTAEEAIQMGITNAVTYGPFLIVNGESSFIKGNGGWGYAARTAIGQRADGIVLFLVVDSNATRTSGASMVDLTEIMENYGAVNAANLDGGTSSVMVLPQKYALKYNTNCTDTYCYINNPVDGALNYKTRPIATSFIVVDK